MKRNEKINVITMVLLVLIFLAGMLTACSPASQSESEGSEKTSAQKAEPQQKDEDLITRITKRGSMRVGLSIFITRSFKDKNGDLIGYEIDIAKEIAKDLDVDVEFIPTEWSGLIPALLTGKFDIIIAGMGIVPERALKVNFTEPYDIFGGVSIVASRELAAGWDSVEDFNKSDVVLAVRLGTTAVDAIKRFFPKAEVRHFDNAAQCNQEVLNGEAHASVASMPEPQRWAKEHPEELFLPLGKGLLTTEPISFALRKGGTYDDLNFFNSWIRLKHAEGWLEERHNYWVLGNEWEKFLE
jgi:polar amino acid transport system substrate-binding protein